MPKIPCECGCGTMIEPITKKLVPARFARGHNRNPEFDRTGIPSWNKGKPNTWSSGASTERLDEIRKLRAYKRYVCSICQERAENRDPALCRKHYWRWKTYGDPLHVPPRQVGENHCNWQGGKGHYGPGFTRALRKRIRLRDGYRCRRCGITQEERGRTLEVHHLDHNRDNHSPDNLVTSCGSCNVWASYHRDEPWLPL